MTMYGLEAVNELLNMQFDVPAAAGNLPGQTLVNSGTQGWHRQYPQGPRQGQPWSPRHALINVETGALRIRTDGGDPVPGMGTLYTAPTVIDWSAPAADYAGQIRNARLCRENSNTPTKLNISFRN